MGISLTICQYQVKPNDDLDLKEALTTLTAKHASTSYWQCSYSFGIRAIYGIIIGSIPK